MTVVRKWPAVAASWIAMYLFHAQVRQLRSLHFEPSLRVLPLSRATHRHTYFSLYFYFSPNLGASHIIINTPALFFHFPTVIYTSFAPLLPPPFTTFAICCWTRRFALSLFPVSASLFCSLTTHLLTLPHRAIPRSHYFCACAHVSQPGFDPVSFLHWLREAYFSSYKSMLVSLTIIILNGAWVLPHIVYGIIYHIQHPFFEQYSLQVWPWENAEAEAAARRGDPPVPPSVPVPSALGVRAITQARKPASAFYAQIKHGFQWVFTEHVYQSCVTTLGMHYILRNVSETALKAYIDSIPGVPVRCVQMLIGCFLFETIFYWGHRLLHHPKLYSVHKDHHSFYTPVVVNSKFFHPIDTFFSSTLPGISPFFLFWDDFHIYTFWCWSTMQIFHSAVRQSLTFSVEI